MAKVNTARRKRDSGTEQPPTRRGARRREALLQAAQEIFLEKGYAATSIEDLVARTGGSKAAVYAYFGNKEGLFGEMIAARCDRFLASLDVPAGLDGDLEQTLRAFGRRVLKSFLMPESVAMMRAMIAECARFPELAERLNASGPRRVLGLLTRFLAAQHEAGRIDCPEAELAAVHFMGMLKGSAQQRALLGLPPFPLGVDAEHFVDSAVRTFLRGHATQGARR